MSTTQVLRSLSGSRPAGLRAVLDRHFYLLMSLLVPFVVLYGFSRTINKALFHPVVKPPVLLTIHALLFSLWLVLFIVQAALVRARNVKAHRFLGWYFAAVGVAIPVLGVAITRVMALFEISARGFNPVERTAHLAIPLQDMVAFTAAFGLAVFWRRRPEYHRRLMLIATCALTAAAWGRLPLMKSIPYIGFYAGVDGLILLGVLRDLYVNGRIRSVYLAFLPPLVLLQLEATAIVRHRPEWWLSVGRAFLGITG